MRVDLSLAAVICFLTKHLWREGVCKRCGAKVKDQGHG